jgi:hypothetical protein
MSSKNNTNFSSDFSSLHTSVNSINAINQLTVWEADVEDLCIESGDTKQFSVRFISLDNSLTARVTKSAQKAISLKNRDDRILNMALKTVPVGQTSAAQKNIQKITGLRMLFDGNELPLIVSSEPEQKNDENENRVHPKNYEFAEKWTVLAGTNNEQAANPLFESGKATSFSQGAFAEFFKNAAQRALTALCDADEDRQLKHYSVAFFGGERGLASNGALTTLEVVYQQPTDELLTLSIPMLKTRNIVVGEFIKSHENDIPSGSTGCTTIDEYVQLLVTKGELPKSVVDAARAIEEIVRNWAINPTFGLHNGQEPTEYFQSTVKTQPTEVDESESSDA